MWNTVRVRSEDCLLKITDSGGIYEFFLSNLKYIWKNKLKEREIVDIIHELNPHMEADPKILVKKAITSLSERNSSDDIDFMEDSCGITLKSASTIGDYPFKFDLKLRLVLQADHFHELTLPLVLMVRTLKEREDKLIEIIRKKDDEIEDYRLGGAQLSHKILKTKPFDEKEYFRGPIDSNKPHEVIQNPVKYFSSSLNELYEFAVKEITKYSIDESSDGVKVGEEVKLPKHSPDLFDESGEPEAKVMAIPKKMPNLVKVDLKPKIIRNKNKHKPPKKLKI